MKRFQHYKQNQLAMFPLDIGQLIGKTHLVRIVSRFVDVKKYLLLSYDDVDVLFVAEIMGKYDNNLFDNRIKQMKKRHQQRVRDIMRYYKSDLPK